MKKFHLLTILTHLSTQRSDRKLILERLENHTHEYKPDPARFLGCEPHRFAHSLIPKEDNNPFPGTAAAII